MIGQTLSFNSLPLAATLLLSVAASLLLAETSADALAFVDRDQAVPYSLAAP